MAKKPLPATMSPANLGKNPPFVPEVMKTTITPLPKGTYEEVGLYAKLYDYVYNGQSQTSYINQTWRP
jgi:hypothetical protein